MSENTKHAYLIIAHDNFTQLQLLLNLLDDERNDIYLHVDKKAASFSPSDVKVSKSQLIFVDRINVIWGGHSQIQCEMNLLKAAGAKHYRYYHLLSGVDLPLKTQDEIHGFFQKHHGKNFITYDKAAIETGIFIDRTQYYHFFNNIAVKRNTLAMRILRKLDRIAVGAQRLIGLKRKEIVPLYKGANWVSITDEMVQYILTCKEIIKKQFYFSDCGDEVFLQSIAMQSPYRNTIVTNSYRAIDWLRGSPYTYRKDDVPQLLASSYLFARKFDSAVDTEAIRMVVEHLSSDNEC